MNKKRLFGAFLIITALIVMLLPATEADAVSSASAFTIKSGKLTGYKGIDSTVSVPDTVTVIGKDAFAENDNVTKIILPDSVRKIEGYAFWGCDNLKTVVLGDGLTVIDDFAFTNCDGLETISIPPNIKSIGIGAFADCNRFEDITIPPQVTDIREDAFDGDYLLNIHCETGSYADEYAQAFYERQKEMPVYTKPEQENSTQVKIPEDGVYSGSDAKKDELSEEDKAYYDQSGEVFGSTTVVDNQAVVLMQNAGLPVQNGKEDTDVEQNADASVSEDTSGNVSAQPGVIPERAYYREDSLKQAAVESDVTRIAQFAYARSGIRSIALPDGLQEIDYAAFYHCDFLSEVDLPESVVKVDAKAFAHTPWVESFLADASEEPAFLVSGGVLVAYRGDAAEVAVPQGVRVIAGEVFKDHGEIVKVILPATVEYINEDAFKGCSPEEVEYNGSLDPQIVEERVSIGAKSAGAEMPASAVPFTSIAAIVLFLCGCIFVVQKAK